MDLLLWGPSHNQVSEGSHLYSQNDLHCDFHFGHTMDVIEEDALNEKYCLQVLRILVAKADAEIKELEEDVLILQTQLALTNAEWSKVCFAALKERIDSLEILIEGLKDVQNKNDPEVLSELHREPPERIHVIVRDLLRYSFQPNVQLEAKTVGTSSFPLEETVDGEEDFEHQEEDASRNALAKPQVKIRTVSDSDSSSTAEKLGNQKPKKERKLNHLTSGVICTISREKNGRPLSSDTVMKDDEVGKNKNDEPIISDTAKIVLTEESTESSLNFYQKIDSKDNQNAEKHGSLPKQPGNRPNLPMMDEVVGAILACKSDVATPFLEDFSLKQESRMALDAAEYHEDSRKKLVPTQDMETKTEQRTKVGKSGLYENELVFSNSLMELVTYKRKDASKSLIKVKQNSQVTPILKPEADTTEECSSHLSLKRKSPVSEEPSLAEELGLKLASLSKGQQKSVGGKNSSKCNDIKNIKKENQQVLDGAKAPSAAPHVIKAPVPKRVKGKKISASSPVIKQNKESINFRVKSANMHADTTESTPKEYLAIVKYSADYSANSPVMKQNKESSNFCIQSANMHADTTESTTKECLAVVKYCPDFSGDKIERPPTVAALRALAKEHKLRRYSKLRKAELQKLLELKFQASN